MGEGVRAEPSNTKSSAMASNDFRPTTMRAGIPRTECEKKKIETAKTHLRQTLRSLRRDSRRSLSVRRHHAATAASSAGKGGERAKTIASKVIPQQKPTNRGLVIAPPTNVRLRSDEAEATRMRVAGGEHRRDDISRQGWEPQHEKAHAEAAAPERKKRSGLPEPTGIARDETIPYRSVPYRNDKA